MKQEEFTELYKRFSQGEKDVFHWGDLRGLDLSRVNLAGANLRGADLMGADLEGANLTGTIPEE